MRHNAGAVAAALTLLLAACGGTPSAGKASSGPDAAAPVQTLDPAASEAPMDGGGADATPAELSDGQTATVGDLQVTAEWGAFDPTVTIGDGPQDKGCTVIRITAKNTGKQPFMTAATSYETSGNPQLQFAVTAGDELRSASFVATAGTSDWPKRIKAGATSRWTMCAMAEEREQHLVLQSLVIGVSTTPLAAWART